MTATMNAHTVAAASTPPSTPRLQLEPTGSRLSLLDGGWWPRSTDPVAELPGLVLAIDKLRGLVSRLVLNAEFWDSRPGRLRVADRVLRLGYFASQPVSLLTALCDNGERVDLLVVAPGTDPGAARAALLTSATTGNLVHAQSILGSLVRPVGLDAPAKTDDEDGVWEDDGGRMTTAKPGQLVERLVPIRRP
ncbi:DUF5994 family protein [Hamadaea tsunoensis]|uniref:DUF5994 family protein n=1 Tax=Hamadaea tsunoensis TaxID=53368 RepID=UPI0004049FE1|nr:DUF5994 family protein [Hamadaea tsunoensis]